MIQRLVHRHPLPQNAQRDTADDIDRRDDESGRGISLNILRGTVHGAEEARLILELLSAGRRLLIRDGAGIQVSVDGHLFAGHGIQRESGRDLGDTFGTFVDDDQLHDDQDDVDHDTDDQITAADELAEDRDDPAGIAGGQDHTRRRDIEAHPEDRAHEQDRRVVGQFQDLSDIHGIEEDPEGKRHVHSQEDIQQPVGQRDDEHDEGEDDIQRNAVIKDPGTDPFHVHRGTSFLRICAGCAYCGTH